MAYVIKLKRSNNSLVVKHVTRNVALQHVGRRGPQGIQGIQGPPGSDADALVSSVNGEQGDVVLTQDDVLDGTTYKQYSQTEKTKLSGIATGATANSSDATLLARANHTGTQAISTVSGLQAAIDAKEDLANKSTSTSLGSSDTLYPSQNAVKSYVDTQISTVEGSDVDSFNGRTGTVIPATDDYTWAQINKATSNIADITTKSHTSLTDIGTNTHPQIDTHIANVSNPHSVTKTQVGLGNVDNTSDANKPVSTATQTELDLKATIASLTAHEADTTSVHGITDTSTLYRAGGTDVAIADGGTGASTAATARTNLGAQSKTFVTVGTSDADYITDGTADDVQINQAITDMNTAGGGAVFLKSGTFTTAATIVLKSNVKLIGEDVGSTIITGAASDYRLAGTTPSGQTKTVYEDIEVRGINFKSNHGTGLAVFNTTNVTIVGCEFTFTVTTPIRQALYLQHCQNIIITENYAHDYTGNGLSVTGSDYFVISNNLITGGANGDDGIDVDFDFLDTSAIPSNYGTVTGNSIRTIGRGNGIRVENSNYVSVTGNSVDGVISTASIAAGIIINTTSTHNGKGHTVTGNTVTNCDPGGIVTSGTNLVDVSIVGNTIYNCGADSGSVRGGILLNSTGVNVASNLVDTTLKSGTDGAAMLIYKKDAHHIVDNIFRNSAVGVRFWNGDALQSYTSTTFMNNRLENNTLQSVTAAVTATSRLFNNYGLSDYGDMAKQAPNAVAITGGTITGITDLAIADGGTGASTAAAALTNLGLTATAAELNYTDGVTSAIQTQLDAKQTLDSDLTTIAGLTATTDNFIQSKSNAWASRTVAQVKTDLGLTGTNSGDQTSIVGITGTTAQFNTALTDNDFATLAGAEVLTNKAITPRVVSMADATSITPTGDTADVNTQTNTQAAGTLTANAPSGTPVDEQKLVLRIKSTNAQTWSWNAIYRGSNDVTLPTSTTGSSKTDRLGFVYNSADAKWSLVAKSLGY